VCLRGWRFSFPNWGGLRKTKVEAWWYYVHSLTEQKLSHPINGFWCTDSSSFSKFMAVVINPWHTGKNWLVIWCTRMKNFGERFLMRDRSSLPCEGARYILSATGLGFTA
jgi:hypothetical protein